ncbi:MAG: ribosome recycling factor [Phycisphaerae bacterium]|nr:ribosome recycling factor [Phycisphaerae bacterium]MBN8598101.1 ribosome recycling factor [Planctomycetota bacterium]
MTDPDTILLETEETMTKALEYLKSEIRGIRTGRASPAMVDFIKADYYGSMTDLKSLAAISVPEPSQLLIKPFDAGSVGAIKQAIEASGLGLNPQVEGKQIRLVVPALSTERRTQLSAKVKKMGEEQKTAIRNVRRDANKHADGLTKQAGAHFPEDEIEKLKEEIQQLLKKYEDDIDKRVDEKVKEIQTV